MNEQLLPKTIGILKTPNDPRVCMLPKEVKRLTSELKHKVFFEPGLGDSLLIKDQEYEEAGATAVSRNSIFTDSDLILSIGNTYKEEELGKERNELVSEFLKSSQG